MRAILTIYKNAFSNIQPNVWTLAISLFINRSGSMVLLFTSLYLTQDLNFSKSEAGIAIGFYGVGSIAGSYFGGWLTDRKHYLDVMVWSLIGSGCILFSLLLAKTPVAVALVVFCYAFIADIFRPANAKAVGLYSTPENRPRSIALVRMALNLGFTVGPALGGLLANIVGYPWLFVLDALTSIGAGLFLYAALPRVETADQPKTDGVLETKNISAYKDKTYLFFVLLVALYALCFFQLFASVPQFFDEICKYDEPTIGLLLALNGIIVVLLEMPIVAKLENYKRPFVLIGIGALCIPVSFCFLVYGKGLLIWAIIYTIIITLSEIFAMPFMMNFTLARPAKERQGQYSALYSIAYGLGHILASMLGLGIADYYGFNTMFYVFMAVSIFTAMGFLYMHKYVKK